MKTFFNPYRSFFFFGHNIFNYLILAQGNVVAANAPVEAIKFSMPGLMTAEGQDITQTVQALTLPDGTTTLIGATQKDDPGAKNFSVFFSFSSLVASLSFILFGVGLQEIYLLIR